MSTLHGPPISPTAALCIMGCAWTVWLRWKMGLYVSFGLQRNMVEGPLRCHGPQRVWRGQRNRSETPALHAGCVALGELCNLSEPRFAHPQHRKNHDSSLFTWLTWGLCGTMCRTASACAWQYFLLHERQQCLVQRAHEERRRFVLRRQGSHWFDVTAAPSQMQCTYWA